MSIKLINRHSGNVEERSSEVRERATPQYNERREDTDSLMNHRDPLLVASYTAANGRYNHSHVDYRLAPCGSQTQRSVGGPRSTAQRQTTGRSDGHPTKHKTVGSATDLMMSRRVRASQENKGRRKPKTREGRSITDQVDLISALRIQRLGRWKWLVRGVS